MYRRQGKKSKKNILEIPYRRIREWSKQVKASLEIHSEDLCSFEDREMYNISTNGPNLDIKKLTSSSFPNDSLTLVIILVDKLYKDVNYMCVDDRYCKL